MEKCFSVGMNVDPLSPQHLGVKKRIMNRAALAILLVFASSASSFPMPHQPRVFVKTPTHPDYAIVQSLVFLATKVDQRLWPNYRFFHFLATNDDDLVDEIGDFQAHLPLINGTGPTAPLAFPIDKDGRVYALDITTAGWTAESFHEVARLDITCREKHIHHLLADELRRAIGVTVDVRTFHCEGLVPGPWFVREVQETDRHRKDPQNIAYYNLLYTKERFGIHDKYTSRVDLGPEPEKPKPKPWPGGIYSGDGKNYAKGEFEYVNDDDTAAYQKAITTWKRQKELYDKQPTPSSSLSSEKRADGFIDRDFPRDLKDFRKRWGAKSSQDFLDDERQFKANGVVVAGGFNDPKNGSYVSDNDRILRFLATVFGLAMETNDFESTVDRANIANFVLQAARDDVNEAARELIFSKQDDAPAYGLVGPKALGNKRVESGDPHIVHDRINGGTVIVQTFHKCNGCHYPSDILIPPSNNKLDKTIRNRNDLRTYSVLDQQVIDQFLFDGKAARGGWQWKLKPWREPFSRALAAQTATGANPEGWAGTKFAAVSNARRDYYDAPVVLDQFAAELGYSRLAVVAACAQLTDPGTIKIVAGILGIQEKDVATVDAGVMLLNDDPGVPRAVVDANLFPQVALVLAMARDVEDPAPWLLMLEPELLRDPKKSPYQMPKKDKDNTEAPSLKVF